MRIATYPGKFSLTSFTEEPSWLPKFSAASFLVVLAIFLAFTPFFSPIPIHTDVQPAFIVPICLLFFTERMRRFTNTELIFLALSILSIVYIDLSDPYLSYRKSTGLLIAFLAYHFFRVYYFRINSKILFFVVLANSIAVAFHYLSPHIFAATAGQFVRTIKILSMEGARGASGFSAEPGFAGAMGVFYLSVALFIKEFKGDTRFLWSIALMCLLIIALSKSGTGGLLLIAFVGLIFFRFKILHLVTGFLALIGLYVLVSAIDFGRAGYAIKMLLENPYHLFLVDSSVGHRVNNIVIGLISIYEFPFGTGAGSFSETSKFIIGKYKVFDDITGKAGNISAFAKYSVELGIFFWLFMALFSLKAFYCTGPKAFKYLFIAFFFISASFSIVFPPIWFLFAALHNRKPQAHGSERLL